jgi:phosphohistidine swiveling domain-containing protein
MLEKGKKFIIIFDEYNIVPQVAYSFGEAVTKDISKYLDFNIKEAITFWRDWDSQLMCLDYQSYHKASRKILALIKKDPEFGLKINRDIVKIADKILLNNKLDSNVKIAEISNEELFKRYSKFLLYARKQFIPGSLPMILDVVEQHLSGYLLNYLINKSKSVESANKAFSLLTHSLQRSPIQQEELDFLKIIKEIKNKFHDQSSKNIEKSIRKKNNSIYKKIINHHQEYHCLTHDFRGPDINIKDIFDRIIKFKNEKIKIEERLLEIINEEKNIKFEQKKLIKKYQIDKHHQQLIKVLQGFLFSKLYRKNKYTHASYFYNQICLEIAKRINFSQKQVWFLLPAELKDVLTNNKTIDVNKINLRLFKSIITSKAGKTKFITGKQVEHIFSQIDVPEITGNNDLISGQVSYPGKIIGKVKIVLLVNDIKKVNKGDVLVSIATNPDLLPAMKKAGAIITNAGGITCHAAIVSRELKTPCIIGTKIATKVLKDGDLVEVDANKGEVKILKRK